MPTPDTWRTQRRTFATGSGLQTTAGEAEENIPTGGSGTVRLYKGPLTAPTLLEEAGTPASGGFTTGFANGFAIGSEDWVTVEAFNLTESPIWTGSRVIVSRITLKGGEPNSTGWVIVEHNAATVLRAQAPATQTSAGNSATFTNVLPLDGVYLPTSTESIYCPVDISASQIVVAHYNYNAGRWEADPVGAGSTPSGDVVRTLKIESQSAVDCKMVGPTALFTVWDATVVNHDGADWLDTTPPTAAWLIATNHCDKVFKLEKNENYVGWSIGTRIYNGEPRQAYACHIPIPGRFSYGFNHETAGVSDPTLLTSSRIGEVLNLISGFNNDPNIELLPNNEWRFKNVALYSFEIGINLRLEASTGADTAINLEVGLQRRLPPGNWVNSHDCNVSLSTFQAATLNPETDTHSTHVQTVYAGEEQRLVIQDFGGWNSPDVRYWGYYLMIRKMPPVGVSEF